MYSAYSLALAFGMLFAIPWYALRGRATPEYLRSMRQRFGRLPASLNPSSARSIWVHAVSVGEVLTARLLLERLKLRFPSHALYLSTTTLTGQAIAQRGLRGVDGVFYVPYDWRGPVRRALRAVNPELLVIVETELWPNLIHEAHRRGARVALVNGRISPRSFARYLRIRGFLRHPLAEIDRLLMQSEPHAERIRAMGAPAAQVRVSGNLKFDASADVTPSAALQRLLPADRPLLVAGSTVAGEEELVLDAFVAARAAVPGLHLLLAPRHPERCPGVAALLERRGLRYARRSAAEPPGDADVLLLDTLGELAHAYPLATAVFVGGSLLPMGGHNVLEPAVAARAVVVGPHMENFQEIAAAFLAEDALVQVGSAAELAPALIALLRDAPRRAAIGARAAALVARNRGALERTLDALAELVA